jgi:hypothetical protein
MEINDTVWWRTNYLRGFKKNDNWAKKGTTCIP